MIRRFQRTAHLQGARHRFQAGRFPRLDDAEDRQSIMPALADPFVVMARQHLGDMPEAEALAGAVDRRQKLARQLRRILRLGR